ncbi:MAG: hypoxanthine phosphoribosyltransferase [Firmicutes bacterium HGW-Firmicutes-13]|nr:MAG: hypoxanthine phosphoribosyltransferase [Firmicutes bacterium HGW-Firmicutes-13]
MKKEKKHLRVFITREKIKEKVEELGQKISEDFKGQEILLICVLKGGVVFLADLMRQISIPVKIDFIAVSSYGASTKTSGVVRILKDLETSIENKQVIIVEDIVDTGLTLRYLKDILKSRGPASLKICALLDKADRRLVHIEADYLGFVIPDEFVVGYGLDCGEKYRNLADIYVLSRE